MGSRPAECGTEVSHPTFSRAPICGFIHAGRRITAIAVDTGIVNC
jgi:hypothetical protein